MEEDLYAFGNIIYAEQHSLKTVNETASSKVIAGVTDQSGYKEGKAEECLFNRVISFYQSSRSVVILVDCLNHCIRLVDRINGVTEHVAGYCGDSGYKNGMSAKFTLPSSVIEDKQTPNQIIVADYGNSALRTVITRNVTTFLKSSKLYLIRSITQEKSSGNIYACTQHAALVQIIYETKCIISLFGTETSNGLDDPRSLTEIALSTYLVAVSKKSVTVVNTQQKEMIDLNLPTISLCNNGECRQINLTIATLLYNNNSLYVGISEGGILQYKRKLPIVYTSTGATSQENITLLNTEIAVSGPALAIGTLLAIIASPLVLWSGVLLIYLACKRNRPQRATHPYLREISIATEYRDRLCREALYGEAVPQVILDGSRTGKPELQ